MSIYTLLGWTANALFFARFLVQWLASERAGRSVAPVAFWWLSLLGSIGMSVYTGHRGEPVLMVGVLANAFLYGRNIMLSNGAGGRRRVPAPVLVVLSIPVVTLLFWTGVMKARAGMTSEPIWLACVLVGQALWSSRFVIQWLSSERRGESHFPLVFWWVSLAGNLLLLAYNVHLADAILVAGFVFGPLVQIRNIMLILRPPQPMHAEESAARAG
ncbi:MAG TPA: hypothetical protein ENJ09_13050 [Planctomycetes bacterium]|nr:hypothetical protein [Planctomycetota bacterium]